jgi:hypothetical protein
VWAVRASLSGEVKTELATFLESSLAAGLSSLPEVARQQIEPGWSPEETEAYLRRFHYRLGPDDLAGLERFEQLILEHGLAEQD